MESIRFLILRIGVYFFTGYLIAFLVKCFHLQNFNTNFFEKVYYPLIIINGIIFTEITQIFFNCIFGVYYYIFCDKANTKIKNLYPCSFSKMLNFEHFKIEDNNPIFLFSEFVFNLSLLFGNLAFICLLLFKYWEERYYSVLLLCLSFVLFLFMSIVFRIQANKFLYYYNYHKKNNKGASKN